MKKIAFLLLLLVSMMNVACDKPVGKGDIELQVSYTANGRPLMTDSLCYVNEAGNQYMITEIQWFISNFEFQNDKGEWISLDQINYIDTNIPESQLLRLSSLPEGTYQKLRFTFGLDENDNVTGRFSNPPERDMFWPEPLGGGYHYMKLNGKYLDENGDLAPMNIHLGIGQNEDLTAFYQNYFTVELPLDLDVKANGTNVIQLNMNVDNWFCSPNTYDITTFGSAIMQDQEAQQLLKENGHDVFSIKTTEDMKSLSEISKQISRMAAPKPHFMTWENLKQTLSDIKERL